MTTNMWFFKNAIVSRGHDVLKCDIYRSRPISSSQIQHVYNWCDVYVAHQYYSMFHIISPFSESLEQIFSRQRTSRNDWTRCDKNVSVTFKHCIRLLSRQTASGYRPKMIHLAPLSPCVIDPNKLSQGQTFICLKMSSPSFWIHSFKSWMIVSSVRLHHFKEGRSTGNERLQLP